MFVLARQSPGRSRCSGSKRSNERWSNCLKGLGARARRRFSGPDRGADCSAAPAPSLGFPGRAVAGASWAHPDEAHSGSLARPRNHPGIGVSSIKRRDDGDVRHWVKG